MVELLLIAHLLVQHNQLPLDLAALHDLGRKAFLYLGELLLLDFGGRLLELLGHLLLDLALLLDLQSETNGKLPCPCQTQGVSWPSRGASPCLRRDRPRGAAV